MKAKYNTKPGAPARSTKDPEWFGKGACWAIDTGTQFTVVAVPDKDGRYSPLPEPVGVTRKAFEARYQRMP